MATRKYELMVILDPARSEEEQKLTLDQIDEIITRYGGTPDRREVMGKRRLAYPIKKRRDGYYVLVYFDTETTSKVIPELDQACRIREDIVRHLIVQAVLDKSKGDPSRMERVEGARYGAPAGARPHRPRYNEENAGAPAAAPAAEAAAEPAAEPAVAPAAEPAAEPDSGEEK